VTSKLAARPEEQGHRQGGGFVWQCANAPARLHCRARAKWNLRRSATLGPEANADDVIAAAEAYSATANGIIPWRETPAMLPQGRHLPHPAIKLQAGGAGAFRRRFVGWASLRSAHSYEITILTIAPIA